MDCALCALRGLGGPALSLLLVLLHLRGVGSDWGGGVECRGAQLTIVAVDVCTPYSLLDFF